MEEIDIKDIFTILFKNKLFIICVTLVIALITFVTSIVINELDIKKKFEYDQEYYYAETRFIVGTSETMTVNYDSDASQEGENVPVSVSQKARVVQTEVLTQTYFELIKSRDSLEKIINDLELDIDYETFSELISLSQVNESDLLSLVVTYNDETKIIEITNAILSEFISNMENAYTIDKVAIIDSAHIIDSPNAIITFYHNTFKYTLIAIVIGLCVSSGIVFIKEMYSDNVKNEKDLENLSNTKCLVKIDKNRLNEENQFALLKLKLSKMKTILVSAPEENKNLFYISNNLVKAFAKSQKRVLFLNLIYDTDSSLDNIEKIYDYKVVADAIIKDNKKINKFVTKAQDGGNYDILYINQKVESFLDERKLKTFLLNLENIYSNIIINANDVLNNACTYAISKIVRNIVIVATEDKTNIKEFAKINESSKNIKGFVYFIE